MDSDIRVAAVLIAFTAVIDNSFNISNGNAIQTLHFRLWAISAASMKASLDI